MVDVLCLRWVTITCFLLVSNPSCGGKAGCVCVITQQTSFDFPKKSLTLSVPYLGLLKYLFYTLRTWIIEIFIVINLKIRNIRW